jgi:hypothetical protein
MAKASISTTRYYDLDHRPIPFPTYEPALLARGSVAVKALASRIYLAVESDAANLAHDRYVGT